MTLAQPPTSTAFPGWRRRCLNFALTLGMLHIAIAVALTPILGGWVLLYAVFPPYLLHMAVGRYRSLRFEPARDWSGHDRAHSACFRPRRAP